ncbi:MAG: hypothetical protein DME47_07865 [Verrucomicrobia bacterium]|nr:MAG: hypothetical protein DME47_07865 [Verrucomicrobiota bacterium]
MDRSFHRPDEFFRRHYPDRSCFVSTHRNSPAISHCWPETAHRTRDWNESVLLTLRGRALEVRAFKPKHWGARLQYDVHRGYNSYVISRENRRIIYGSDTAMTDAFAKLNDGAPYDLAIMGIGAYDPWIWAHSTPEQAVAMADAAGARFIIPVHHQTFRLSVEPFREPIERFTHSLSKTPERIALHEIGETFVLPCSR